MPVRGHTTGHRWPERGMETTPARRPEGETQLGSASLIVYSPTLMKLKISKPILDL